MKAICRASVAHLSYNRVFVGEQWQLLCLIVLALHRDGSDSLPICSLELQLYGGRIDDTKVAKNVLLSE